MLPKSTNPPNALLDAAGATGLAGVVSGMSLKKSKASAGFEAAGFAAGAGVGALKKSAPEGVPAG